MKEQRQVDHRVSALDPLADASRNGRHRPRDFEGSALKHCAGRVSRAAVWDAGAFGKTIGQRYHAARGALRGGHARPPHEGVHYPEIARSPGGFFFVWTLWALGALGGFTFILSVQGLWGLRRGRPRSSTTRTWESRSAV